MLFFLVCLFTGRVPISVLSAVPHMGQRSHLRFSRDPQSGSASLCSRQAGVCSLQEEKQFGNNWRCLNDSRCCFFFTRHCKDLQRKKKITIHCNFFWPNKHDLKAIVLWFKWPISWTCDMKCPKETLQTAAELSHCDYTSIIHLHNSELRHFWPPVAFHNWSASL